MTKRSDGSKFHKDPKSVWAVLGSTAIVWEIYCLFAENGGSLTEATRDWLDLSTPQGKWMFLAGYGLISAWFPAHALKSYDWSKNPMAHEYIKRQIEVKINARESRRTRTK